jgi:hypothetical protein
MQRNQLIILIVLGVILLILLVFPFYLTRPTSKLRFQFRKTSYILTSLIGYLNSITGKVGAGKTSFASGVSHILQMHLIDKMTSLMKDYQTFFNKINFDEFNNLLYHLISVYKINQVLLITDIIMHQYEIENRPIYNFLNFSTTREFTKQYVFAFDAMVRNNFVASKTRFYSRITHSMNLEYDIRQQDLYEVYQTGNYNIQNYLVEIIDEAQDDNAAAKWREQEETGRKQYRNKIRHIHEETNYLISIKQDSSDEVKKQRSLYHLNIDLDEKVQVVSTQKRLERFIERILRLRDFNYRLFNLKLPYLKYYLKNILSYERYSYDAFIDSMYDKPNPMRDVNHLLQFIKWYLKSLNYNVYSVEITQNSDDLKKESKTQKYQFVIPSIYCFSYPKFEFNHIQTELLAKSTIDGSIEHNLFQNPTFFEKTERMVIDDEPKF